MKRFTDVTLVMLFAPLWIPLVGIVAVLVWMVQGRPVFFHQPRAGRGGRVFGIMKFRTMLNLSDQPEAMLPDEQRLTSFGRALRASSLDELPELWNVFRGEMSLVGPRPLLLEYTPHYSPTQARRLDVLPGITGWAQINGRNALSWEQRFDLDAWYVDHRTWWLDMKILMVTLLRVLKRQGVTPTNHEIMPRFVGSDAVKTREASP